MDPGRSDPDDGESPEEALRRIVSVFDTGARWVTVGGHGSRWGMASLCRVRPGRILHVIGASTMAERLRELLVGQAAPGWELQPLPPNRTPLHLLAEPLLTVSAGQRFYNLLDRNGFATVEEVAATPDGCLLLLRQAGPKMVAAVRLVLHDLGWDSPVPAHPSVTDLVAERRVHVVSRLAEAQRVRYREFTGMLARSSMPLAALDKIIESLNAEAVPAADPLVCLLLETAGEADIARYYQDTHSEPSTEPDSR
jgi:hypothetical protein